MDFDKTPKRPEGAPDSSATPTTRIEVDSAPDGADACEGDAGGYWGAGETRSQGSGTSSAAGGTGSYPYVPSSSEVSTRTVVKTRTKKLPVFLASLGGMAVGAVLVIALVMSGAFRITETDVETPAVMQQTIDIDPEDTTLAEVVSAKALPSVVSISTETAEGGGVGSGVILDTDGNIITNYHVVEGATSILVNTDDGQSLEAEVLGADESSDIAVVKLIDADAAAKLTPIEVGDSDGLSVGEWVMAIGSPFGNEQSVSTGIVSALYRSTALTSSSGSSIYANMIQTDAAINPGNSGGALVNDEGQLIGINSIIESYSGSSSGVGFAIPVNYAMQIAEQIIAGETPAHPYLGVSVSTVNAWNARQENLPVSEGAYVSAVNEGTPAAEAGLQVGDIVTAVDGEEVTSADNLIILLREHAIGDTVTLTVMRDGKETDVDVTLGSDADLQTEQQDSSEGGTNTMTEEEFLEYLRNFLGDGYGYGYDGGRGGSIG